MRRGFGTGAAIGTLIALTGLMFGLSMTYANSDQAARIADDGLASQRASEVAAAASAARSSLALAMVLTAGADPDEGLVLPEEAAAARADAVSVLAELQIRVSRLGVDAAEESSGVLTAGTDAVVAGEAVLQALEESDFFAAQEIAGSQFVPAIAALDEAATGLRDHIFARLQAEASRQGTVARLASFGVGLVVPALVVLVMRWLSRRRQEKLRLEAELEKQLEVNRTKDELIGNLSHELRTPLTGIYGFALALDDLGYDDPELVAEMNGLIISEAAELNRMVDDLLTAAKLEADSLTFQFEPVDVAEEVQHVMLPLNRRGLTAAIECESGLVHADKHRFRQVLRNLLSNAFQHGGSNVLVAGKVIDGSYTLAIIDDGGGIPIDLEGRLFERFIHQGSEALTVGSVGLGLAIARHITEQMGGELTYERREGSTLFVVRLPEAGRALEKAEVAV